MGMGEELWGTLTRLLSPFTLLHSPFTLHFHLMPVAVP